MNGLSRCVIDASVGLKLLVQDELSEAAEALLMASAAEPQARAYVPELFFLDCANVLWKYVARYGYSRKEALRNLADLESLYLVRIPVSVLAGPALRIATEHAISVPEACYIAAAAHVGVPLVTADKTLAAKFTRSKPKVRHLSETG